MLQPTPIALSLAGFPAPAGARRAINDVALLGCRAVAIDATHPETRPRVLDASARRDLGSLLRRSDLGFAGLDLWIPPEHFADPAQASRAVDAVTAACGLSADLARWSGPASRPIVSLVLPKEPVEGVVEALALAAERTGAMPADHAWPLLNTARPGVHAGIEPATLLMAGADPAKESSALLRDGRLASARLSDSGVVGRTPLGSHGGRLDVLAYSVALITGGLEGWVTLDVRGLPDPESGVRSALERWRAPDGPP